MVPRVERHGAADLLVLPRTGVGRYLSANLCAGATLAEREEFSTFSAIDGLPAFGEA
jgi:hypothetical protein